MIILHMVTIGLHTGPKVLREKSVITYRKTDDLDQAGEGYFGRNFAWKSHRSSRNVNIVQWKQRFWRNFIILMVTSGSADADKADRSEELLASGGTTSVQVLNEFAAVASRKLNMPWPEIGDVLAKVRAVCTVEPVSVATHDRALAVVERYQLSWYDALIIASALNANCGTLFSEDLQDAQVIESRLTIRNPYR